MSELHGQVFRALGFEPIAADIKQFVAEIEGGRFDAQDNPLTNIYTFGVHRHHPYITLSGHFFGGQLHDRQCEPLSELAARRPGRRG